MLLFYLLLLSQLSDAADQEGEWSSMDIEEDQLIRECSTVSKAISQGSRTKIESRKSKK